MFARPVFQSAYSPHSVLYGDFLAYLVTDLCGRHLPIDFLARNARELIFD
jgi:hypothetical protein